MGRPAAKKGDKIISATAGDIHIVLVPSPGGPVPTPLPHPCKSNLKMKLAKKVNVQGKPGAMKGSKSKHMPPHFPTPPGVSFQRPPKNEAEVFTASSNVNYEGRGAAMLGDTGLMCCDPSDMPIGVLVVPPGTVYVGGGMTGGAAARGRAKIAAMKAAAAKCHQWINSHMPPGADREAAHRAVCTTTGHPVDVVTGKVVTRNVELRLPGRIPVEFVRNYASSRLEDGPLGFGWRHSYQISLLVHPDFVALRDDVGRFVAFPPPALGAQSETEPDPLVLTRDQDGYAVVRPDGLTYVFRDGASDASPRWLSLAEIRSPQGATVRLVYRDNHLDEIVDTAGRRLRLQYGRDGRVHQLLLSGVAGEGETVVRRYGYDDAGDLVAATDELGHAYRYQYANHLLTQDSDRTGFTFYFAYDDQGWCVRTWGDEGINRRQIDYDRQRQLTRVVDGEGATTIYGWNDRGVVESEQDPYGEIWAFGYDDAGRRVRVVDPGGNEYAYAYDHTGQVAERVDPEGNTVALTRDAEGRITAQADALGRSWTFERDSAAPRSAYVAPDGARVDYAWTDSGDLAATRDPLGRVTRYRHDEASNLVERTAAHGPHVRWQFDGRGRLLQESDDQGPRVVLDYDAAGRVVREAHRDLGVRQYAYDPEGNLIGLQLPGGCEVTLGYGRFNRLLQRTERAPDGATRITLFAYDSENRLTEAVYPGGERARFRYDRAGRLLAEQTGDGRWLSYRRDASGFLAGIDGNLAAEAWRVDGLGRAIERSAGDLTVSLGYQAGVLSEAENAWGQVGFGHDAFGRVVEESGPWGDLEYAFDAAGRFSSIRIGEICTAEIAWSDDGYRLAVPGGGLEATVDQLGRVAAISRDNGRNERRWYEGGRRRPALIDHFEGRRRYSFDAAGRVVAIEDTGALQGTARFERDGFGRLVHARLSRDGRTADLRYVHDERGNRTPEGQQFVFAPGNRLEVVDGRRLQYDADGRITAVERREGDRLELRYDAFGQLAEATTAACRVRYTYDALGRRLAKSVGDDETRFVWDGNRLAGEILPDGRQRAYVYHGARPYPLLIVELDAVAVPHVFYYHNDHRGCPEAVTDEAGEVVWRAAVDPFGNVLSAFPGKLEDFHQPLLLPGQYRDRETGLVYNFFRYYLPELTLFTTPDLIGNRLGPLLYAFPDDPISQCDLFGLSPDDYDQSQRTPHHIVEINGVKYVEFDAAFGFTSNSFVRPGGNGSEDHFASIGPNGEVVVMEGRHRAVAAAAGDPIPEDLGGIAAHPGHLRYPLGDEGNFETTQNVGPSLLDLAMDPNTLANARSGKKP